ncbi:DUF4238 domain-containing protein [Xanthomonas euroxanthea]|uniref:DUF4238 domain-containing protein n=1 Tax=Xanthomonas euroxanthea TaxID=2259622 RepID=UPI0016113E7D|nr:DUF4238 domain-containing protein [Xanthomonas euroxanthea]MBB5769106.1 hypothetical protein [Xanthomonas euroxanthea]
MTAYKNQHYVPRTHLKPFTKDGEGKAISLFNLRQSRLITGAPAKNQCSRDYFYGHDLKLERSFQKIEGRYGSDISNIQDNIGSDEVVSTAWMRLYWCLQWARTEAAAESARAMGVGVAEIVRDPKLAAGIKSNEWVHMALRTMQHAEETVRDLKMVLINNATECPFVTSDNPAVVTNRLHLINKNIETRTFGINNAGALLCLPLTPKVLALFFDSDVYAVGSSGRWYTTRSIDDVAAFNELQFLACMENVYPTDDFSESNLQNLARVTERERRHSKHRMYIGVRDGGSPGWERYRFVKDYDPEQHGQALIVSRANNRIPSRWPGFLRWKFRGRAFDSRTGVGIVRRSTVEQELLRDFLVLNFKQGRLLP